MSDTNTAQGATATDNLDERREKMIKRVRQMIAMATDPAATEAEAAAFREKADELIEEWAIEEHHLTSTGQVISKPGFRTIMLFPLDTDRKGGASLFSYYYQSFSTLARHCSVMFDYAYLTEDDAKAKTGDDTARNGYYCECVGFESDLQYLEMLFMQVRLELVFSMEPTLAVGMTLGEASKLLRESGMAWPMIEARIKGFVRKNDLDWGSLTPATVYGAYGQECKRLGVEKIKMQSGDAYRLSVGKGFTEELSSQVWTREMARRSRVQERGNGADLALRDRDEQVREAFYDAFPHLRPKPVEDVAADECPKCKRSKSGTCRDHKVSYRRRTYIVHQGGKAAGQSAARRIDLGGSRVGPDKRGQLGG
jgi:hypothetical protein